MGVPENSSVDEWPIPLRRDVITYNNVDDDNDGVNDPEGPTSVPFQVDWESYDPVPRRTRWSKKCASLFAPHFLETYKQGPFHITLPYDDDPPAQLKYIEERFLVYVEGQKRSRATGMANRASRNHHQRRIGRRNGVSKNL
jgi:hypothetical protein